MTIDFAIERPSPVPCARFPPDLVRALNSRDQGMLVVALHDGNLESLDEQATRLRVQGFCRPGDLAGGSLVAAGAAFPASTAVH